MFNEIGERTLKSQIENELVLPKQTRFLVPLDFTAVEKFYYDTRYNEMLEALGLNHDGAPREQIDRLTGEPREWSPDKAEMVRLLSLVVSTVSSSFIDVPLDFTEQMVEHVESSRCTPSNRCGWASSSWTCVENGGRSLRDDAREGSFRDSV